MVEGGAGGQVLGRGQRRRTAGSGSSAPTSSDGGSGERSDKPKDGDSAPASSRRVRAPQGSGPDSGIPPLPRPPLPESERVAYQHEQQQPELAHQPLLKAEEVSR